MSAAAQKLSAAAQKLSEKIAREVHQKKEMEERTLLVWAEQKRKKDHEKKVKQQLEEYRMIRKMKPIVSRAKNFSVDELRAHVEAIETFVAENGRPSDILADLLETLKVQTIPVTNAGGHFAMDMERSVVLVDASRAMGADLEIAKKEMLHITKEKAIHVTPLVTTRGWCTRCISRSKLPCSACQSSFACVLDFELISSAWADGGKDKYGTCDDGIDR